MKEGRFHARPAALVPRLHLLDRGLARRWIKQRLAAVFPELRGDQNGLEVAYRALNLEPTFRGDGGSELVFELKAHPRQ